jgi:PAS domain S-box-containing protein
MPIAPILSRNSPGATGGANRLHLALAESELRYRRLFETAQDGILILDAETGKIIDVNPYLLDLLGYPFETIVGRELWEIGLFEDIAANRSAFETLRENKYIRYENRPLRTRDGKQIAVEFVSNAYFVGAERVTQCNIRDLRQRSTAQLDDCNEKVNALHVAGKAKDHVLAILAHELRTPLSAISSTLDLVELGHTGIGSSPQMTTVPPEFDDSAVAVIRRNVANLVRLITELLDVGHFAKGSLPLNLETVDGHKVIRLALNNLEQQHKSKQIALDLRLHAANSNLIADAQKLEQIISNLVGNALKFTPQGGTVSVVTRNDAAGDFIIEVEDSGIGISGDAHRAYLLTLRTGRRVDSFTFRRTWPGSLHRAYARPFAGRFLARSE